MRVIKPLPDMCRCSDALLVGPRGIVTRVQSCPVCVGKALEWFGTQLDLFSGRESVSVSAVIDDRFAREIPSAIRQVEAVVDGLPF